MNLLLLSKAATVSIVVICVLSVVAVIAVLLCMLFKNKKKPQPEQLPQQLEDKVLLSEITRSFEALIILAKDNEALIEELKSIQQKINYLIATEKKEVVDVDRKIQSSVKQLRELLADEATAYSEVEKILLELKLAISDRNAIL